MTPVSYYVPSEVTSPRFAFAFAKGCHGTITDETDLFPGPVALFGSPSRWAVLRTAQADGRDWYYGDHGYMRRGHYYRITKNAYQHDGTGSYAPDRFERCNRIVQPWRVSGSHVLVCPNSAVYCRLHGFDVEAWIADVSMTLRQHTDREIRVRWKVSERPIKDDLADAWAVVVYSSAAAIDALIAGVPAFTLAPFGATYRMGSHDLAEIESPQYPMDREPFVWALAYQQWTLQEIVTGVAWRALREADNRAA